MVCFRFVSEDCILIWILHAQVRAWYRKLLMGRQDSPWGEQIVPSVSCLFPFVALGHSRRPPLSTSMTTNNFVCAWGWLEVTVKIVHAISVDFLMHEELSFLFCSIGSVFQNSFKTVSPWCCFTQNSRASIIDDSVFLRSCTLISGFEHYYCVAGTIHYFTRLDDSLDPSSPQSVPNGSWFEPWAGRYKYMDNTFHAPRPRPRHMKEHWCPLAL